MQIMGINLDATSITVIIVILIILLSQFRQRKFRLWRTIITMIFMLFVTILFVNIELPANANYALLIGGGIIGLLIRISNRTSY